MSDAVAVIVVGQSPYLQEAVDSALQQTRPAVAVLVVEVGRKPLSQTAHATLAAKGVKVVTVPDDSTDGLIRNAAVESNDSPWFVLLDPDDRLEPSYLQRTIATAKSASACFVTTGARMSGGMEVLPPHSRLSLAEAIARPDLIHSATLISRDAWKAIGGFDEALPQLAADDLWLRLLDLGFVGAAVAEPLIECRSLKGRRSPGRHSESLRTSLEVMVAKHRSRFVDHLAATICARDGHLGDARAAGARLNRLSSEAGAELMTVRTHVEATAAALADAGAARIDFGDFARVTPIGSEWRASRGRYIDRRYIEHFLETHAGDIRGRVLEVNDDDYTRRFGGARVTHSDVIGINPVDPRATVVDDLKNARTIPSQSYDCFILTQTLHLIYDMQAVLREAARVVAPGGVVLATLPCASRLAAEQGLDGDFWRFTAAAARRLFGEFFPQNSLEVRSYGNVLVTIADLYGLARHELSEAEFEVHDPYFPLIIGVRAQL